MVLRNNESRLFFEKLFLKKRIPNPNGQFQGLAKCIALGHKPVIPIQSVRVPYYHGIICIFIYIYMQARKLVN